MDNSLSESNQKDEGMELYEQFLDSRSVRERRDILRKIKVKGYLTDRMINDFAVTLDVVISDGDLEDRYYDMMKCIDSMARFETTGLR